jgi:hypothetical protein
MHFSVEYILISGFRRDVDENCALLGARNIQE